MCLVQSSMGTDGNRAVASNETILSRGPSFKFFIVSTNLKEFLHTCLLFSTNGWRILLRSEERASCGAPMWLVMRRAGKSLLGLCAFIAGLAEGVSEPEG